MGLFDSGFESLDPLMTAVNAGRIARQTRPQTRQPEDEYADEEIQDAPQKPMPEVEPGILRKTGEAALGGIGAVGNFLDLPGSMVRDVATWLPGGPKPANPFDQLLSPFSGDHRTSGRDLLRGYGLAGEKDSWGNFAGGLGAEIALDPLTYVGVGLASRAGNVAKKANLTKNVTQKVNQAAEKVAKAAGKEAPKKLGWLQARLQATPSVLIHESDDPAAALAKFYEVGGTDAMLDKPINTLLNASIPFAQWIPYLKKSKYSGTAELVGKKALVHPDDAITAARQQRQADALFSKYAPQQSAAANAMDAAGDLADDATSSTPNPTPVNPTPQPQVQPQVQPQPQPQPTTPQPQPTTQGVGGVNDGGAFDTATYLKQVVRPSDDQHMIDLARELMNSAAGRNGGAFTHKQLMDEIDAAIDEGLPPEDASTLGAMFQRAQQLVPNKKNLAKKGKGKKTAPTTPSQPAQETPEIPTSSGDPGSPTVELDYDSEFGSRPATDGVNQDILDNLTPMTDSIGEGFVKSDADRKYLADRNFVLNPAKKRYERQYGVKKNEITPENPDISGQNPDITPSPQIAENAGETANSSIVPEVSGHETPLVNRWLDVQPGVKEFTLDRPGQASARAQLSTLGDGTARIDVTDFAKAEGAPKGSGKAALRELADTAKEHGATAISGNFTTHSALGALGSEFGKHNIRFFDKESGKLLDIDFAEAMKNPEKYIAEADLTKPKDFAPTKALPGTKAHAEVMKQRAELGLPLQHPDDARPLAGSTYIQQFSQSLAEGKSKYHARQEALAAHLTAKGLQSTWQDINQRWFNQHIDNLADDATDDEILRAFEASTDVDSKIPGEHWLNKEPTIHGIQQVEKSRKEAAEFADRMDKDAEVLQALGSKQADGLRKQAERARQLIAKSHDLEADVRAQAAEEAAKIKAERDEILRWKDEPQTTASTETALANAIDDRTYHRNVLEDTGLYTNGHMVLKVPEKTRQTLLTKSVSRGAVNEAERASAAKLIQDHLEKAKALASQPAADVLGHRKQSFTETSRSGKVASVDVHSTLLRSGKEATAINTKYHLAIQKMFKGATYHFKNADGPIAIVHKGEVVGSIMPLAMDEIDDATKTAMSRVKQAAPGVAKSKGKVSDARVTKDTPPGAAAEAMNPNPLDTLGKQEPFAPVVTDGKLNSPATTINFEAISPAHAAYQKNVLNPLLKAKVLTDGDVAFLQTVLSQSDMRLIDPSLSATKLTPKIASKAGAVMDGLQGVYDNTLKQIGVNPKKHADHTRPEILLHETGHHIFRQLEATDPELYQKALDALLDGITNGTLFKYFKRTGKNVEYFLSHEHEAFAQLFANISAGKIKPDSLPSYLMDAVRKVWSKLIDYARLVIGSSAAGSPQLKTLEKIVEYAGGYIPRSERDEILNALKGNAPAIRANTNLRPDSHLMRIPKLGEMMQSPQAQGLRQSFTNWMSNLPDGFADTISDAVAKGESIIKAIPGVKEAIAAFDYAVMGARTASGQSHARLVMERMEKARANVRRAIAPLVRAMEGTSFFDEAHIAQELSVSPEQAKVIANTRSMNLKGFVEAVNPIFYNINEMPAEVKAIAHQIQQMFADTLEFEAKEAGLSIAELQEYYAAYAARMARKPGKTYSRNPLSGPQVDTTFPAMQGRKSFLKNLPAGTMVIDQLSIDPKISGIVQRAAVIAKNLKRTKQIVENAAVPTKEQLRTYLFENYGPQLRPEYYDRMLKNIDPAAPNWQEAWKITKEQLADEAKKHDEVVKGLSESLKTADETAVEGIRTALKQAKDEAKKLNPAENEQFDELINWLSNLDPAYVTEQSPIFGRNILHDTMQRLQDGQTAAHVTLGAQKYLGESLRRGATTEDQGYDFNKLFSDLKMDSAKARQNVIRHMAEEYRDEHAKMLEETTQEVLEQIEDLLGSPNDKDTTIKAFSHQVMDHTPDHLAGPRRGGIGHKMDDLKFVHREDGSVTIRQGKGDEAFDYDMDKLLEDVEHLAEEDGVDALEYLVREMVRQDVDKKFLSLHNAPKEVYDDMTRWMKPFTNPDEIEWWRNGLNRFMNIFRGSTTAPFPSFHVRNFVSGQAQNFFFHAYDPTVPFYDSYAKPIRDAWTMRNGEPIKDLHKQLKGLVTDADIKAYQDFQLRTWKRTLDLQMKNPDVKPEAIDAIRKTIDEITNMKIDDNVRDIVATRKLADEIFANGLIGSKQGQAAEIVGDTTSLLKSQMPGIHTNNPLRGVGKMLRGKFSEGAMEFSPAPPGTSTLDALTPTAFDGGWTLTGKESNADMFILARWGRDFGSLVEDMNRISPYLAFRKQGYTAEAAAEMVNKIQIDYTKLSNFERRHMRTMIPFWTFSSRALQMTAEDLIKHPGGKQAQTIRAINLMRDKETPTPEYIQNSLSIPLGELSDGSKRYITGFGLPLEDSTKFAKFLTGDVGGGLKEIGGRLNPLIKYPIESAMGRSMFYDGPNGPQELSELDPTLGRTISNVSDLMTGERTERPSPFISRGFEHVFANSPFARYGTFARQVTDPRKWEAPLGAALDLGTGIKVKDVSPAAQDTIATQRAAKLFKELGGRNQEIPYFPKDKIEKLSPEDKATVESIQGLLDTVRERRKLRREMQEAKIPTAR